MLNVRSCKLASNSSGWRAKFSQRTMQICGQAWLDFQKPLVPAELLNTERHVALARPGGLKRRLRRRAALRSTCRSLALGRRSGRRGGWKGRPPRRLWCGRCKVATGHRVGRRHRRRPRRFRSGTSSVVVSVVVVIVEQVGAGVAMCGVAATVGGGTAGVAVCGVADVAGSGIAGVARGSLACGISSSSPPPLPVAFPSQRPSGSASRRVAPWIARCATSSKKWWKAGKDSRRRPQGVL